jgi:hypothetical protein
LLSKKSYAKEEEYCYNKENPQKGITIGVKDKIRCLLQRIKKQQAEMKLTSCQ